MTGPILRCIQCCKDTVISPCQQCGQTVTVVDRTKPHTPHWIARTISTVACKICDREITFEQYMNGDNHCNP